MAESSNHRVLVNEIVKWVGERYLGGITESMLVDNEEANPFNRPPLIYDFIPDVFLPHVCIGQLIIGEAKTVKDFERRHTREQINAFLHKCNEYDNSVFVLAVPWRIERLAKSILLDIKKDRPLWSGQWLMRDVS